MFNGNIQQTRLEKQYQKTTGFRESLKKYSINISQIYK